MKSRYLLWRKWIGSHNHLVQAYIWIFLGIPTFIWWKESILWVAAMSLYANIESSFAAHGADREKASADKRWEEMSREIKELKQLLIELKEVNDARDAGQAGPGGICSSHV